MTISRSRSPSRVKRSWLVAILLSTTTWAHPASGLTQDLDFERRVAAAIGALERDPAAVGPVLALLREAPRYEPLHRALVATAERQGDWLRALRGWRQLEELAGRNPGDQVAAARAALAAGAYELARCQARSATVVRPADQAAWLLLARVDEAGGRYEEALHAVERALAVGEPSSEALLLRGELLYGLMRIPEAVSAFADALERDPEAGERVASFALSGAIAAAPQVGALRERLESHAGEHPDSVNTRYALGVLAMREDRAEDARRWLEPLAERLDLPPVYYNLALAYRALGKRDAAERALARFQELEDEGRARWEESNRLDRLRGQAAAAREAGAIPEALSLWGQASSGGVLTTEDLLSWGETLLDIGEVVQARHVLDRALAAAPADARVLGLARRAAEAAGDEPAARAMASRAALLDPASWGCSVP
jgi:tetratricopeptide (TPR) repeat protein